MILEPEGEGVVQFEWSSSMLSVEYLAQHVTDRLVTTGSGDIKPATVSVSLFSGTRVPSTSEELAVCLHFTHPTEGLVKSFPRNARGGNSFREERNVTQQTVPLVTLLTPWGEVWFRLLFVIFSCSETLLSWGT